MSTRMAQEITEQPAAVRRTLDALLPLRPAVRELVGARRRVLFAARGTSDNAAIYGRYLLETHAGVLGGLLSPSVATHYRAELDLSDTVVVSVSQSGATEEIVATQAWARAHGAVTVAVANVAGSPLVEEADLALVTRAGPEVAVPADQDLQRPAGGDGRARHGARSRPGRTRRRARPRPRRDRPAAGRTQRRRRRRRGAARHGLHRRLGPGPAHGHGPRDRAQARGDVPAPGARLLVRRPAPRTHLRRDGRDDRRARGSARRTDAGADDRAGRRPRRPRRHGDRHRRRPDVPGRPASCTFRDPRCPRPWRPWARSSPRSSWSRAWPAPSASIPTDPAGWPRSPPPIPAAADLTNAEPPTGADQCQQGVVASGHKR